jgi:hypothetical protein
MSFRRVKAIMEQRIEEVPESAPWDDREFQEFAMQEQITDFPNQGMQLPANEFPSDDNNENQNQLHLNYHEH